MGQISESWWVDICRALADGQNVMPILHHSSRYSLKIVLKLFDGSDVPEVFVQDVKFDKLFSLKGVSRKYTSLCAEKLFLAFYVLDIKR